MPSAGITLCSPGGLGQAAAAGEPEGKQAAVGQSKGVVVECDTSVKQIILGLNEKGEFIIEDLDDTHVFVDSACIEQLRADIDEILNENTYKVEESK
ncbi:hypothetical protein KVV02_003556 [Mortierella alpina]|uniref:General transcription and DNA repair factor IIH subunit TFB5 n=1 Tax=Mortierella alpina TaxID=64518 RepID=A0A9P8AA49_MORAP|nr:hypothetical protein KVV02_003556 [Mortierella alpina]